MAIDLYYSQISKVGLFGSYQLRMPNQNLCQQLRSIARQIYHPQLDRSSNFLWVLLLSIVVTCCLSVETIAQQNRAQFQSLTPCLTKLTKPRVYPLSFDSLTAQGAAGVTSKAKSQYFVAYSPLPKQNPCWQKNLDRSMLINLNRNRCKIISSAKSIEIAKQLFKSRYQSLYPVYNEDYRAAAADLVNRWEQDRKVTASDELPLSLEIEDAWIFAKLKSLQLSLPDYVRVEIDSCK
jgi:hypothetical protein